MKELLVPSYHPKLSILVVDDDPPQLMLLRMLVEQQGYRVLTAENGMEALELFRIHSDIRLVVTDLEMPIMDGFELIRRIRQEQTRYTYLIVLTSNEEKASVVHALNDGADDFLTKPALNEELQLRIKSGIRLLKLESQDELILSLAKLAEYRSEETGYHLERVQRYTGLLGRDLEANCRELSLTIPFVDEIALVTPLHDIGKVAIPDNILHKPGRLIAEEFETMKTHSAIGGKMLLDIYSRTGSHYLKTASDVAMFHHEKYDGKGYPQGLAGDEIPISARIMALADIYDAMTSVRCYKDAYPHEKVRKIILEERGKHLDPLVVDSFLRQENEWLAIKDRYQVMEEDLLQLQK
ncbi:MAG: response regulator [Proteobacteria bacterium]|nr:response regulator [Pseudomonadota bacterium]MBU1059280.1 response regulator [Pseudomonadota bacterium]